MTKAKMMRPRRKKSRDGKRSIKITKSMQQDMLTQLKDKLEDDHIKRYTFIVKGSKMYTAGVFWSEKNKCKFVFRSTYEFAFFYQLEDNPDVLAYEVEPFEVPYKDPKFKYDKVYKPDVLVAYKNGQLKLLEIKPKRKLTNPDVKAKAAGARAFLKEHFPEIKYEFVTEDEIFKEPGAYMKLLGRIDPEKHQKRLDRGVRVRGNRPAPNDTTDISYVKSKLPNSMRYAPFMLL